MLNALKIEVDHLVDRSPIKQAQHFGKQQAARDRTDKGRADCLAGK
jgi:hypothetical protein